VAATLSLQFADHLTTPEIEAIVASPEQRIRATHPEVIAAYARPRWRMRQLSWLDRTTSR
jgi:hypothetical protein